MKMFNYIIKCTISGAVVGSVGICLYIKFRRPNKQILISIDGNIGSGKSTLVDLIKSHADKIPGLVIVHEPVRKWKKIGILNKFYSNPMEWAFQFQSYVLITRTMALLEAINNPKNKVIITERCLETDLMIFCDLLGNEGCLNKTEMKLYSSMYELIRHDIVKKTVNGIIYVDTDPTLSYSRIVGRNRLEETPITKEYVYKVHKQHEKWLKSKKVCNTDKPIRHFVYKINGELDFKDINSEDSTNTIKNILKYIKSIQ